MLLYVNNARQLFAVDVFSRRHFQMHFFLGTVRFKSSIEIVYEFKSCITFKLAAKIQIITPIRAARSVLLFFCLKIRRTLGNP